MIRNILGTGTGAYGFGVRNVYTRCRCWATVARTWMLAENNTSCH
jgi:hypothetical protein